MPAPCSVRMIADAEPRDVLGAVGQRAIADHRVLRVGVHVEHRRVVQRDADGVELGRQRPGETLGQLSRSSAPARPSVIIGGHSVNGRFSRATRPPFLVDADPQRDLAGQLLRLARQIGDLLGRLDVAREEDDAAEIELARQRPDLRRHVEAVEPDDRQLTDMAANVTQ